jgi:hypothetical protein
LFFKWSYNILKEFFQYISSPLQTTKGQLIQSKALQTASTVPQGLSRNSVSKVCFAYLTGTHLYSSPNISLNGHSVIFHTIKTI